MSGNEIRHTQRVTDDEVGLVRERVLHALSDVYDPCCREKGISVVDMGLLENVEVDGGRASIEVVLTTGWCPFVVPLLEAIRERAATVPGVDTADVEVSWQRPWTTDRLSEDARRKLRFLPDPASVDRDAYVATHLTRSSSSPPTSGARHDR